MLVTVPLGVLKKGSIEFQPPLPQRKQEAIDRMGFGVLNKVRSWSFSRSPGQFAACWPLGMRIPFRPSQYLFMCKPLQGPCLLCHSVE